MKLYAMSLCAFMYKSTGITAKHCAAYVWANNDDEALGKGMRNAQERWHLQDGWSGCDVAIMEITGVEPCKKED